MLAGRNGERAQQDEALFGAALEEKGRHQEREVAEIIRISALWQRFSALYRDRRYGLGPHSLRLMLGATIFCGTQKDRETASFCSSRGAQASLPSFEEFLDVGKECERRRRESGGWEAPIA